MRQITIVRVTPTKDGIDLEGATFVLLNEAEHELLKDELKRQGFKPQPKSEPSAEPIYINRSE